MAARASMATLIALLRTKMNDADEAIWTDAQLQDYLDMHRTHLMREKLTKGVDDKIYHSSCGLLEGDPDTWDDDAEIIKMWNSSGSGATAVTPDTFNLIDGTFGFTADQDEVYYLDAISYDFHGAIAECLEQLASDPGKAKQWTRGGVSYTHYDLMEMAKYHRSFSGLRVITVRRTYRMEA
jgi:hypothetical protein